MADHFKPVAATSFGESERQRQHTAAGRPGNALHYVPEEYSTDAADVDNDSPADDSGESSDD
jgi:hypothetical protein